MVRDKVSDMVAAERAGVPHRYHVTEGEPHVATTKVSSLLEAALDATKDSV